MPASYYGDKKDKAVKKITFYLTRKSINQLQNYYGIAIRATCQASVQEMRKAVGAVLFHCSEAVQVSINFAPAHLRLGENTRLIRLKVPLITPRNVVYQFLCNFGKWGMFDVYRCCNLEPRPYTG